MPTESYKPTILKRVFQLAEGCAFVTVDDLGPLREKILNNCGRILNQGSFELAADQRGASADMQVATGVYPLYELLQV